MSESVIATSRLLVTEVMDPDHGVLLLRRPVLVEAGQRYRVDWRASALVVESTEGEQRFAGDREFRCHR